MKIERGTAAGARALPTAGWVVGYMRDDIGKTDMVEVKLWQYDGSLDYPKKVFHGTECIVVYGGILALELEKDGECHNLVLHGTSHDYVVLGPGIEKRVIVLSSSVFGVTVRWPSSPCVNEVRG